MPLTNRDIFEKALAIGFDLDPQLKTFITDRLSELPPLPSLTDEQSDSLDSYIKNKIYLIYKKWTNKQMKRNKDRFERNYSEWLSQEVTAPEWAIKLSSQLAAKQAAKRASRSAPPSPSNSARTFASYTKRSKDRLTEDLRVDNESDKLLHAAKVAARAEGRLDLAHLIDEALESPARPSKLRRFSGAAETMEDPSARPKPITLPKPIPDIRGLAFLLKNNQTRDSYMDLTKTSKEFSADIWPSYEKVRAEKDKTKVPGAQYLEHKAFVSLKERLYHNDTRLFEAKRAEFDALLAHIPSGGELPIHSESKWGTDSATGQSEYQQAWSPENRDKTDNALLTTCLVPLSYKSENKFLFRNPVPQGSTFCQPLILEWSKETEEKCKEIENSIDTQFNEMPPHRISVGTGDEQKTVVFHHTLKKTMFDTKIKNFLTDTKGTLRCFICKGTPNDFTNFNKQEHPTIEENLEYGSCACLHAILNSFSAFNSVSDKSVIKKWRVITPADKAHVAERKAARKVRFLDRLGLVVDAPRAGGKGNSNSGNVARRAFAEEKIYAEVIELDEELIHRTHNHLIAINSDIDFSEEKLAKYGEETNELFDELYPWHKTPVGLHFLWRHSHESLKYFSLPFCFYSEQPIESVHKVLKHDRLHHSRKDSRLHSMQDQFDRQTARSDILVALVMYKLTRKEKKQEIPAEVQALCVDNSDSEDDD